MRNNLNNCLNNCLLMYIGVKFLIFFEISEKMYFWYGLF